uniref:Uncharacterized protein n=1 Tax=Rhizophora mucronata TaxID=61149 RepID=A0A2P2LZZ4_RHIMU
MFCDCLWPLQFLGDPS